MPEVRVNLGNMKDPEAKKVPERAPVKSGVYDALVMEVKPRPTNDTPPLDSLNVEFQLIHGIDPENKDDKDKTFAGRRVWQTFVLGAPASADQWTKDIRRAQLVQFLDAAGVVYTESGFNSDHFLNKTVRITIQQKTVSKKGEVDKIYTNVVYIDTAAEVDEKDLV